MDERLVQEYWKYSRVIMLTTKLPDVIWGEATVNSNWLRNRQPSTSVNFNFPLLIEDPYAHIEFKKLLEFGGQGYEFS